MKKTGEIIKYYRGKGGYSVRKLAAELNVAPSFISGIENDKKNLPGTEIGDKIIEVLKISPEDVEAIKKYEDYKKTPESVKKELEGLKKKVKGNAQIISEDDDLIEIPVYGDISAGNGRIIYGDVVDHYTLDKNTKNIDQLIAIRVAGESMENKIPDGSQVLIRRGVEVENGNVGAFCIGEECFVKQLKVYGGTAVLRSFNPAYKEIEVQDTDEFITIGKVVECKIKF